MKSPGGCVFALVPMLLAMAFLWRNGELAWVCWTIFVLAGFQWLSAEAVGHSREAALRDRGKLTIYRYWNTAYGIVSILFIASCFAAIIAAIYYRR